MKIWKWVIEVRRDESLQELVDILDEKVRAPKPALPRERLVEIEKGIHELTRYDCVHHVIPELIQEITRFRGEEKSAAYYGTQLRRSEAKRLILEKELNEVTINRDLLKRILAGDAFARKSTVDSATLKP